MHKDTVKRDNEGRLLEVGDEVVAFQAGLIVRGKVIALDIPNTYGCIVIQSLIEKSRTMLLIATNCVIVAKATAAVEEEVVA